VPAPRIDHLLGNHNNQQDSQDFEDLLRRAAALLSTPAKSPQSLPEEALVANTKLLRAKAS
jgi:hypothetical protein